MTEDDNIDAFDPTLVDDIVNIDMEELEGMSEPELREHFLKLARGAKPSKLSAFLYGRSGNGDESLEEMETDYVERRLATIRSLKKVREAFDGVLSQIEGDSDASR